jgi:hypothetical protein
VTARCGGGDGNSEIKSGWRFEVASSVDRRRDLGGLVVMVKTQDEEERWRGKIKTENRRNRRRKPSRSDRQGRRGRRGG